MMMTIIVGCAKSNIIFKDFKTDQIIHYSQMKNIKTISNYVVYLNKGDKIPLKMTLDSEILDIANEEINLILKQKVYFRLRMPDGINSKRISAMSEENKQKLFKFLGMVMVDVVSIWKNGIRSNKTFPFPLGRKKRDDF